MADQMDALQMQQMQAMLANMGTMPGANFHHGPEAMHGGMPPAIPGHMDMAQIQMMQVMQQFFQQNLAQQSMQSMTAAAAGTLPGMPMPGMPMPGMPPPFPGMGHHHPLNPYAQPPIVHDPTISVSVEGMKFQYQLTEDDLMKVFSRYGSVLAIRVDEAGASATISFAQAQDAQSAMTDLNNKVLNGLEGTLRITWLNQPAAPAPFASNPYAPAMPFPGWGGFPPAVSPPVPGGPAIGMQMPTPGYAKGGMGGMGGMDGGNDKSPHGKGVRKYTCRFLIGIDNDKDFQVARRIIGAKGANMKRIVKQTEAKLRLRGVGSGYFEGTGQKESSEPLQLCVSCTSMEGYRTAVTNVEELLKRVYEEYRQYCRDGGMDVPSLEINLSENQLVYSRFSAPGGGGGGGGGGNGGCGGALGDSGDGDGSPRRDSSSRRSRRSRGKDGRTEDGELDRGEPGPNAPTVDEIEKLIDDRNEARRANNFTEADRIRELLHKRGVALMDEPGGRGRGAEVTTWRYWRD